MDAAGSMRAAMFRVSEGGPLCATLLCDLASVQANPDCHSHRRVGGRCIDCPLDGDGALHRVDGAAENRHQAVAHALHLTSTTRRHRSGEVLEMGPLKVPTPGALQQGA